MGVVMGEGKAPAALDAEARAKGEYRCAGCGYGVTIYRELPRCPMCGEESWEQLDRGGQLARAQTI